MTLDEAQQDITRAHVGGGPGAIVSGFVWLAAGLVLQRQGFGPGFTALFFGGMLIFPIATLTSRLLFRRGAESAGNRLGRTALESTIAMIGGFFASWLFLPVRPDYVFPLAAIAVGTHYFAFRTVYGDALYWVLGGLITAAGLAGIWGIALPSGGVIFAVAAIEIIFGFVLTWRATR